MFLWPAATIIKELRRFNPGIADIMEKITPALYTNQEQEVVNDLFPMCVTVR